MTTVYEDAIEASYYAGKLWGMVTNPDIAQAREPADYKVTLIPLYPDQEDKLILAGEAATRIKNIFQRAAKSEVIDNARSSLGNAFCTLERIMALEGPGERYTTYFSNVQLFLGMEMENIRASAQQLGLTPEPV